MLHQYIQKLFKVGMSKLSIITKQQIFLERISSDLATDCTPGRRAVELQTYQYQRSRTNHIDPLQTAHSLTGSTAIYSRAACCKSKDCLSLRYNLCSQSTWFGENNLAIPAPLTRPIRLLRPYIKQQVVTWSSRSSMLRKPRWQYISAAMGVRRNFSRGGNVKISLIIFKLLMI